MIGEGAAVLKASADLVVRGALREATLLQLQVRDCLVTLPFFSAYLLMTA